MSKNDAPAGSSGGPVTVPALDDLPEKMRVHALAKLLGLTSREVLAALTGLGHAARSAASSVERKVVEQVIGVLVPGPDDEPSAAGLAPEPPRAEAGSPAPSVARAREQAAPGRVAPLAPVFAPAAPLFQAPARPEPSAVEEPGGAEVPAEAPSPRRRRRARAEEPAVEVAPVVAPAAADEADEADEAEEPVDGAAEDADDDADSLRRRRRRGRRGRGRGRGGDETDDDASDSGADDDAAAADETDDTDEAESDDESEGGESEGSRRRRRRRRRRGSGDDATEAAEDPPGTVTRIRAPRESRDDDGDGVQSVRGSTRLEAKRQRRRDGRDAGRRRQPILSEAEFLARRESVERTMVVRERAGRVEIGVLEDDVLVEHFVTGHDGDSLVGNIYLGRVQNVLPSMEAAFVDIGRGRNAVLYAGEVDWDAAGLGGKARRIEQALSSGDSVLVQVTKDPIGHKGARLTTQISMAGRFLVYVPAGGAAGISRKLPDVERKRLKDMLRDIVPSEAGVIIRTASEGVSQEALERDVRRLQAQWEVVKTKSEQTGPGRPKAPALLYEEPDLLIKVVRDQFNEDFSRLVVEGDDAWDTLHGYLAHVAPELADRMHRHVGRQDVFAAHRIDEQLLKALDRKVWLPSGGTLVIDRTEAMTVVDVNTGKFTGSGGNLEETVTRNNLEAAEEIVRQLRLRDVGGIIVIDFIDMVLEANRDLVLKRLTECLARDRTRHQVAEVTSLGLVQMTRKRVGGGLLEHFSTPCEHCKGRGVVVDMDAVEPTDPARGPEQNGGRRARTKGRRGDGETNGHHGGGRSNGSGGADAGTAEDHAAVVAATAVIAAAGRPAVDRERESPLDEGAEALVAGAPAGAVAEASATEALLEGAAVAAVAEGSATGAVTEVVAGRALGQGAAAEALVEDVVSGALVEDAAVGAVGELAVEVGAVAADPSGGPGSGGVGVAEFGTADDLPATNGAGSAPAVDAPAGRPRRRSRVTRTAGAPTATSGEAPVAAVVTVPAAEPALSGVDGSGSVDGSSAEAAAADRSAPSPDAPAARPRRTRRAASRPAGPPAEGAGSDPV